MARDALSFVQSKGGRFEDLSTVEKQDLQTMLDSSPPYLESLINAQVCFIPDDGGNCSHLQSGLLPRSFVIKDVQNNVRGPIK